MGYDNGRITELLGRIKIGDRRAESELLPIVYRQLHDLAVRQFTNERRGHTLQPTALISELYIRVIGNSSVDWKSRAHFFAVSAQTIRRILVDHARTANAERRPKPNARLALEDVVLYSQERADQIVEIDEALNHLAEWDPRMATVVELRVFGGLSVEETAEVLDVSPRTVKRDWTMARAWLSKALQSDFPRP